MSLHRESKDVWYVRGADYTLLIKGSFKECKKFFDDNMN